MSYVCTLQMRATWHVCVSQLARSSEEVRWMVTQLSWWLPLDSHPLVRTTPPPAGENTKATTDSHCPMLWNLQPYANQNYNETRPVNLQI